MSKPIPARCGGCAFTEGTEANKAQHTQILSQACVMAREVFTCHEDGRVCRGYAEAIQGPPEPRWKQHVAKGIVEVMSVAIEMAESGLSLPPDVAMAMVAEVIAGAEAEEE